jgi:hypothetical protein
MEFCDIVGLVLSLYAYFALLRGQTSELVANLSFCGWPQKGAGDAKEWE